MIYSNPATVLKRAALRGKEISLPSTDNFNGLIAEMRTGHGRDSLNCADFALGLAVTGMRKGKANALEWRNIDFEAGEMAVRGDADTDTKNWELRRVPLIPDARSLFQRMLSERAGEPLGATLFRARECQKALDRACKRSEQIQPIPKNGTRDLLRTAGGNSKLPAKASFGISLPKALLRSYAPVCGKG